MRVLLIVLYALKRIDCQECESEIERCRREIPVQEALMELKYDNLMSTSSEIKSTVCYMLFPYMTHSLREDIDARHLLGDILES